MKKYLIGLILLFIIIAYIIIAPYYLFLTKTLGISLPHLLFSSSIKTINNSVDLLVLGIAGGTHDGPNLSDSINVIHYDLSKNTVTTFGIPRDIWSATLEDKINSAYAYGEATKIGGGIKLAKAEVSAIVGLPIQYVVVIDFQKFESLIDDLGGIDINVPNTFTDKEFPITGKENDLCGGDPNYSCRYETLHFDKGPQHMDGKTALKFVRSRHADGQEGSDFARNRRQQLMISAIKERTIAIIKSHDIHKINNLYMSINQLLYRDIDNVTAADIIKQIILHKNFKQKNAEVPQQLFEVPDARKYNGKYVLIPTNGMNSIHQYVQCVISSSQEACLKDQQ